MCPGKTLFSSLLLLANLVLLAATESNAAVYNVTTTEDSNFPNPDPTILSLRNALTSANQHDGVDLVSIPAGTFILSNTGAEEDNNLSGDLDIKEGVFIVGEGPDKTFIDGGGITRVLHIVPPGVTVVLVNLTIQNGRANDNIQPQGAGILNKGTLVINRVAVINNTGSAINNIGGGIYNDGALTITNATFSGNYALRGGALFADDSSQNTIEQSLFVNNRAYSRGGAIETFGTLEVKNTTFDGNTSDYDSAIYVTTDVADFSFCTIMNNSSGDASGALNWGVTASLTLRNSILAANITAGSAPDNCSQPAPASSSYNLEDANTCGFSTATNLINTDPKLGPLQDNGGPTQTRALAADSRAIDYVNVNTDVIVDQRSFQRPVGPWADIGAYEYERDVSPLCFPLRTPDGKTAVICL